MEMSDLELFTKTNKGACSTIISAAGGTQYVFEKEGLNNGVFTASILELMRTEKGMKVSELKEHVGKRVLELTNGMQKPTSRNETIAVDWSLW
jgi:hypothetical protein